MTSFVLKIIALITMFIDHLGYAIYGKFSYLNYIGRIAFPIFAFQISEGFVHTKNIKKYFIRLLVFAIISQFPFMLFLSTFSKNIYELNIFFTLSFGLLAIFIFDKIINTNLTIFNKSIDKFIKLFLGLLITFFIGVIAELLNFDYGLFGIAIIFMFYLFKNDKVAMIISFITAYIIKYGIYYIKSYNYLYWFLCTFNIFPIIFISLYNKKQGPKVKYLLYLFYPIHLLVLYLFTKYI